LEFLWSLEFGIWNLEFSQAFPLPGPGTRLEFKTGPMPAANVIQLRQLLKEKLPDLRLGFDGLQVQTSWPTGVSQIDEPLQGGLPKGALIEITAGQRGSGSALLMSWLLRRAAQENQIIALVDGHDSFDVTAFDPEVLSRLLWVRCNSAEEALKASDLVLRDGNLSFVLLDLIANPAAQLRKIPATTWFRFQRIVEQTSTVCIVLTPQPMVSPAQVRISPGASRLSLSTLESEPDTLMKELKLEVSDTRRSRELTAQGQSA
jgi:hypothetical protein